MNGQQLYDAYLQMTRATRPQGFSASFIPWSNLPEYERDAWSLLASYVIGEALKFVQRV